MVVTLEPGLYFRPDALDNLPKTPEMEKFAAAVRPAFEKYKGIGVRIEDDVLITTGEPKVISAAIPSKLEDVEAAIARLRQSR
jgi:Xaa-Pro aminopeptidase